jgi:hypothetical protein
VGRCGLNSPGSGYGPLTGSCMHGNEPWDSMEGGGYILTAVRILLPSEQGRFHGVSSQKSAIGPYSGLVY